MTEPRERSPDPFTRPGGNALRLAWIGLWMFMFPVVLFAQQAERDPAAWGADHVGKPLPQFTSGDECLFCHRMDVGPTWSTNRHGQTIRTATPQSAELRTLKLSPLANLAENVEWILGGKNRVRFLKQSETHGRVDLLSVQWVPMGASENGKLVAEENPRWDQQHFADRCAGCHASGVNSEKRTFTALSLDCFVCHGDVPDKHTTNPSLTYLSPQRTDPDHVVVSICAQCHLRTGSSRSTGLPYANQFVAGDNLFRDFSVELSEAAIAKLNPGDRHVQENVRDVVVLGKEGITCLSCHDVHGGSSTKHHLVADGNICLNCHAVGRKKKPPSYTVHSSTCEY